ncbi:MAG TPA: hypothetical protein VF450_08225 [Noviherbaspirillum sp.]
MDFVFLELLCWGGLIFFFWALKDGLGRVESDIEAMGVFPGMKHAMPRASQLHFAQPQHEFEPIGSYQGATIHRYVQIDGRTYQFDRVSPLEITALENDERLVLPGLVYQECREPAA